MYSSLFGSCSFPRSRTCNCSPRPFNQQKNDIRQCTAPSKDSCAHSVAKASGNLCCNDCLIIKNSAFGGFVLPDGTEKRATFLVASLTLDTSHYKKFLVQLNFSCNPISSNLKIRLRFYITRQERGRYSSVPVSAGILYFRDRIISEADSFTLSVYDYDSISCKSCSYSVHAEVEEFEPGGNMILANPNLIATIINTD